LQAKEIEEINTITTSFAGRVKVCIQFKILVIWITNKKIVIMTSRGDLKILATIRDKNSVADSTTKL
jgi:hypothetical protein